MYACGKIVKKKHRPLKGLNDSFLFKTNHLEVVAKPRVSRSYARTARVCRFSQLPFDIYTDLQTRRVMQEAAVATRRRRSPRIGSVLGGTFLLLGLAGLTDGVGQAGCLLSAFLEIPLQVALGALSWVLLESWQLLVPCLFGHRRLLESLLQMTVCGWQLLLAFAGAA